MSLQIRVYSLLKVQTVPFRAKSLLHQSKYSPSNRIVKSTENPLLNRTQQSPGISQANLAENAILKTG